MYEWCPRVWPDGLAWDWALAPLFSLHSQAPRAGTTRLTHVILTRHRDIIHLFDQYQRCRALLAYCTRNWADSILCSF